VIYMALYLDLDIGDAVDIDSGKLLLTAEEKNEKDVKIRFITDQELIKIDFRLRTGQIVMVDDKIGIKVEDKQGRKIRLSFKADRSIPIRKLDTYNVIRKEELECVEFMVA